jgi:hypothetical protein
MLLSQVVRLRQGWTHRNTCLARVRCPRAQKKIITKARVTEGNI